MSSLSEKTSGVPCNNRLVEDELLSSLTFVLPENSKSSNDLRPNCITNELLNEESKRVRIRMQLDEESVLLPFFNKSSWFWENIDVVHGHQPSIRCNQISQERCILCVQHALSLSLPLLFRQRYLDHDHSYLASTRPKVEESFWQKVLFHFMEKSYEENYETMCKNAQEQTNLITSIAFKSTKTAATNRDERKSAIIVEGMETCHKSPWSIFKEVEVQTTEAPPTTIASRRNDSLRSILIPKNQNNLPEVNIFIVTKTGRSEGKTEFVIRKELINIPEKKNAQLVNGGVWANKTFRHGTREEDDLKVCMDVVKNIVDVVGERCRFVLNRRPVTTKSLDETKSASASQHGNVKSQSWLRDKYSDNRLLDEKNVKNKRDEVKESINESPLKRIKLVTMERKTPVPSSSGFRGEIRNIEQRSDLSSLPQLAFKDGSRNILSDIGFSHQFTNCSDWSISSRCSVCLISFKDFEVKNNVLLHRVGHLHFDRRQFHESLHGSSLNCVFYSCRNIVFRDRQSLVCHMDAHRQALMRSGVEDWDKINTKPSRIIEYRDPNLTCDICLIDFNWRNSVPGLRNHVERYYEHWTKHSVMYGTTKKLWCCVLQNCGKYFDVQYALEKHMWFEHAVRCHCSKCDWIVWGDPDEVEVHRQNCRGKILRSFLFESTPTAIDTTTVANSPQSLLNGSNVRQMSTPDDDSFTLRERDNHLKSQPTVISPKAINVSSAATAVHLKNFSFYCEHCGAPYRRHHYKQYEQHVSLHLPYNKLTCVFDGCGKQFTCSEQLHAHVKTKLCTCRYCGVVLFEGYKRHILTCRTLHEIEKQRSLKEAVTKMQLPSISRLELSWFTNRLCTLSETDVTAIDTDKAQESFLSCLNLIKGNIDAIKENTRRQQQLKSQIQVANGKGRRSCTMKSTCVKCGRIFRNSLNLREHMRGYHNDRRL